MTTSRVHSSQFTLLNARLEIVMLTFFINSRFNFLPQLGQLLDEPYTERSRSAILAEEGDDQSRLTVVVVSRDNHVVNVPLKDVVGVVGVGGEAEGSFLVQERRVGTEQDDVPSGVVTLERVF
jgi:hypothetical protein